MFSREMTIIKRTQFLAIAAMAAGAIALSLSTVKSFLLNRWVSKRENVACVPADAEYTHPVVYRQTFSHPVDSDAKLKTFVEQYVHLTEDESIVDYHAVTTHERYDKAKLSKNKWQAIEMSTGLEKINRMRSYGDSNELYRMISDGGVGWNFLIDEIIIHGIPQTGPILAIVRGQYQVTYDKAKVDLPHKLWGYKELRFIIIQGAPSKDAAGNYLNKTGLFVNWSQSEDISPEDREKLTNADKDVYLKPIESEN
jgi:hypothetical protein